MYNRYIPQSDGSFRRSAVPDRQTRPPQQKKAANSPGHPEPKPPQAPPVVSQNSSDRCSAEGFLRNLLPKNLDTGDLIVVLLLLLMSEDDKEDKNMLLLTLALYLLL